MIEYVAGFMFDEGEQRVALIRKTKPEWQAGYLNGIGGKIESDETPIQAIEREFKEETGAKTTGWKKFAELIGKDYVVHFFFNACDVEDLYELKTTTDEKVEIILLEDLENYKHINNLSWLIPMALSWADEPGNYIEVKYV